MKKIKIVSVYSVTRFNATSRMDAQNLYHIVHLLLRSNRWDYVQFDFSGVKIVTTKFLNYLIGRLGKYDDIRKVKFTELSEFQRELVNKTLSKNTHLQTQGSTLTLDQLLNLATIRQSDVDEMVKRTHESLKPLINAVPVR